MTLTLSALEKALGLAALGLPVLRTRTVDAEVDGRTLPPKSPVGGVYTATTDSDTLRRWLREGTTYIPGVATGNGREPREEAPAAPAEVEAYLASLGDRPMSDRVAEVLADVTAREGDHSSLWAKVPWDTSRSFGWRA
ncbi:hypothetical protein GCM10010922_24790 [Microbacterium sorbitolivorans]|uniref:Uncharacterized protein n=1 Tax=Microbacterium sorbitolivorans TaxID=1867410 RepID=A0A367XTK3_9MICO|nr:hypothetical protein [Microbacterium sorbitolivorans]RCK56947.1 hypothetical protein DTO57_11465 [Microbacterium sorbitolivorans]GGF47964.1 hypothetical protein GCM10010922_24790 [Microbacterium sorbitolivorans]